MAARCASLHKATLPSCFTTIRPSNQSECHGTSSWVGVSCLARSAAFSSKGRSKASSLVRCSSESRPSKDHAHEKASRRDVLLAGAAALVAGTALPGQGRSEEASVAEAPPSEVAVDPQTGERPIDFSPPAEELPNFGVLTDELNAYSFKFPLVTPKTQEKLPWIETRHPERYSSAAPISSDARQRIVSERIDFTRNITCTVSIGPPSEMFLKGADPTGWKATAVANSVLMDRSSRRMSQGQRTAESEIEEAKTKKIDGVPYFYYEHIQQRSPTTIERRSDTFRHSYAVTAEREGYLYTLNISSPDVYWDDLEPLFRQAIDSFRLLPPTKDYVPPWKDPWRFW